MYTPYVTPEIYAELGYKDVPAEELELYLMRASRQIDTLTFNRIVDKGFDNLTEFQQDIVQTAVCEHAGFLYDNRAEINSALNKYSINGVSMEFGDGEGVMRQGGLVVERSTYSFLEQTGLCCRLAR